MKTLLATAAVLAGMTFGVSLANANLFDGNGNLGQATGARTHIVCTPSGNVNAFCKADVTPPSSGKTAQFDFSSKKDFCFVVCPDGKAVKTSDWQETVSASGEATLQCKIQHF
jgi:hypothetical protein